MNTSPVDLVNGATCLNGATCARGKARQFTQVAEHLCQPIFVSRVSLSAWQNVLDL